MVKKHLKIFVNSENTTNFAPVKERRYPREDIIKSLVNIVLWCNGSTSDSGSASEGSSPSKTTNISLKAAAGRLNLANTAITGQPKDSERF